MKNYLLLSVFFFFAYFSSAQNAIKVSKSCSYDGNGQRFDEEEVFSFPNNSNAQQTVDKIIEYTGLVSNFTINAASVPNAEAVITDEGKRIILYNEEFMRKADAIGNWASISILAHEIGHHLNGHTLDKNGSRPNLELEADIFCGFTLYKMGASLIDAQAAINSIAKEKPTSNTHPPKAARLAAIANGWYKAEKQNGGNQPKPNPPTPSDNGNASTEQKEIADGIAFVENKDYSKAFPLLYKNRNSPYMTPYAQGRLGFMYKKGEGVNQDDYEAVKWYKKAADQGDVKSQYNLGVCYKKGEGVNQDYYEAVKWYKKAADQGDANAQCSLGTCYNKGEGVTQDYYEAVKWYKKAADQGQVNAQTNLGVCYKKGEGVNQDDYEAVKWYKKAADQGYADAQRILGLCYEKGEGINQDYYEAAKWYRKAADQGNAAAQNNLGVCYKNGKGVNQDYYEAVKWYRKAADQGNAIAQNNLGVCYEKGQGVSQNSQEAIMWYKKAAKQGDADAQQSLKNLGETW